MNTQPPGAPQQTIVSKTGPGASAPVAPAAPAAPAPDALAEAKRFRDEAQQKLDAAEKRSRVHAVEARKFADEKKGIGAKLSEYDKLVKWKADQDRLESQAKLNKAAYLEAKFGKDWYDQIVQERINGGAPTADTVALEVAKIEERFEAKLSERDRQREEAQRAEQQRQTQAALQEETERAAEYTKANATEYPLFLEHIGGEQQAGAAILNFIRSEYERTSQWEGDQLVKRGVVLTHKEAAEAFENHLAALAEKAAGTEKYRAKLTEKLKPANTSGVGGGPQLRSTEERRTLSNGLTATTPGQKRTSRSDDERRAAAFAAVDAVKNRQA